MTVGRIYLEDQGGYLGHVDESAHPAFRRREVRWQGRVFEQVRHLPEGPWVYRTGATQAGDAALSDDTLTNFVAVGDPQWRAPSDYVAAPNPGAVALATFEAAKKELEKHPEHAALVASLTPTTSTETTSEHVTLEAADAGASEADDDTPAKPKRPAGKHR